MAERVLLIHGKKNNQTVHEMSGREADAVLGLLKLQDVDKKGGALLGGKGGKRQMTTMSVSGGSKTGGSVSGGSAKQKAKAKSNPWIQHVKAYAKKHGIKYGDAISKAKASYKK